MYRTCSRTLHGGIVVLCVCPLGGLYIQVPLYINYYSVSLGWSLYTGSTVHQLLQCVPWVVFVYRFHCTSTTTVCPLGGLYIQVSLYINLVYYSVSLGCMVFVYRFQCTSTTTVCPLVVFIYRFHCTSTTTVCPLGGQYNTGSTVHQLLQCVPWVVFIIQVPLYECAKWTEGDTYQLEYVVTFISKE